jgi:hypothetical protein
MERFSAAQAFKDLETDIGSKDGPMVKQANKQVCMYECTCKQRNKHTSIYVCIYKQTNKQTNI